MVVCEEIPAICIFTNNWSNCCHFRLKNDHIWKILL